MQLLTIISPSEVKESAPTRQTIDLKSIQDSIFLAERKHIIEFLGDEYYYELLTQKSTNTLTADNMAFWWYFLRQTIANSVIMEALPFMQYQVGTNGVTVAEGNSTRNAEIQEYKLLEARIGANVTEYKKACEDFLVKNKARYPKFIKNIGTETCCEKPKSGEQLLGIYFADSADGCCDDVCQPPPFEYVPPTVVPPTFTSEFLFLCANGAAPEIKKIVKGETILSSVPLFFPTAQDAADYINTTFGASFTVVTIAGVPYLTTADTVKWQIVICCCLNN